MFIDHLATTVEAIFGYVMASMNEFLNRIEQAKYQAIYRQADALWNARVEELNAELDLEDLPVEVTLSRVALGAYLAARSSVAGVRLSQDSGEVEVPDHAVQLIALHDRRAGERADEVEVVLHLQPADLDVEDRQLLRLLQAACSYDQLPTMLVKRICNCTRSTAGPQ